MVLAGVVSALKLMGGDLADHKFLFLGAGEVRISCSFTINFYHNFFFFKNQFFFSLISASNKEHI